MTLLDIMKYDFFLFFDMFSIVTLEESIVLITKQYDAKNIYIKILLIGMGLGIGSLKEFITKSAEHLYFNILYSKD
jgi:hypothetical protein